MQKKSQSELPLHLKCKVENIEKRLLLIPIVYVVIHVWDSCQIIASFALLGKVNHGCTQPYVQRIFLAFGIFQVEMTRAQWCYYFFMLQLSTFLYIIHVTFPTAAIGPMTLWYCVG